jgi:hypothetical protein
MNNNTKRFVAITGIGLALMMPINRGFGDENSEFFAKLSAEWWQWALSIPTPVNPQLDKTGKDAVVGQRGPIWFLAGKFGGGTVTRTCSVPQGSALFFPVINQINLNTPNVCDQGPDNLSVSDMSAASADFINKATNLSVTVDGIAIKNLRRVKSQVFAVALPEDNVFDSPCAKFGGVPAGIYSPAVDDGFYVLLNPLDKGRTHHLHFHAEGPDFTQDVTYILTVVPVMGSR